MTNGIDGGHGMIFYDVYGKMHLCIRADNLGIEETVILSLVEKEETLVIEWEREDND